MTHMSDVRPEVTEDSSQHDAWIAFYTTRLVLQVLARARAPQKEWKKSASKCSLYCQPCRQRKHLTHAKSGGRGVDVYVCLCIMSLSPK